ncbi:hypothetical protein QEN19_001339 [Hanseniaspora menglaensis]
MAVFENEDGKIVDIDKRSTAATSESFDDLVGTVIEQNVLEHQVENKAQRNIDLQKLKTEKRRFQRSKDSLSLLRSEKRDLERKAYKSTTKISDKEKYLKRIDFIEKDQIQPILKDLRQIKSRIDLIKKDISNEETLETFTPLNETLDDKPLPGESDHDFLIRVGKITAFGSRSEFQFDDDAETTEKLFGSNNVKKEHDDKTGLSNKMIDLKNVKEESDEEYNPRVKDESDDEYNPSVKELYNDSDSEFGDTKQVEKLISDDELDTNHKSKKLVDDGDEYMYQQRLKKWVTTRFKERQKKEVIAKYDTSLEWLNTDSSFKSASLNGGFKIPGEIFSKLFNYQKTCVQWLWELHQQGVGGILGDEMGLGKTIQVIAFLAGLHHSNKLKKPILIVCPATVMKQWFSELTKWWPCFRCVIFHSMGSIFDRELEDLDKETMDRFLMMNSELDYDDYINENLTVSTGNNAIDKKRKKKNLHSAAKITNHLKKTLEKIKDNGHVIITTYSGLQSNSKLLLSQEYDYVVLDEGHKIRNPNTSIALTCKKLKCENRLILSGTPIQNNLNELWSLFDFVYPGKLGTLPVFQDQFAQPINEGGYSNASNLQVQTGYRCAVELKNMISPFLLRRVKADVAKDLPEKKELVLFCKLTKPQRTKYIQFLNSDDLSKIKRGKSQALLGIDHLRKICNHPDLVADLGKEPKDFGNPLRSGKMQVVKQLITDFKTNGHKTLLFTQSRQMLLILEAFLKELNLKYLKMDGTTNVKNRQAIVDKFNTDGKIDVFLLTTRVGGLGINLVSATRIIIYDPDWNPSTDLQARERAWRIGQTKEVVIYRLLVGGSIEEKIYHRQIFKQFLTNKILKDPNQKRFFKMDELQDLFSLGEDDSTALSYENTQSINKVTDRETKGIKDGINDVSGIHKMEGYYNEKDETERASNEGDRIVGGLLGVSDTIDHEKLVSSDDSIGKEAARKAKEASEMLKKNFKKSHSRKQAQMGRVTWTGKYGKNMPKDTGLIQKKRTINAINSEEGKVLKRKK